MRGKLGVRPERDLLKSPPRSTLQVIVETVRARGGRVTTLPFLQIEEFQLSIIFL